MTARGRGVGRAAVAAGAAMAVAGLTAVGPGRDLDRRLYRRLNATGPSGVDGFFKAVTELGSLWASVGAAIALSARGRRRAAVNGLGAALVMWGVGQGLKRVVRRPRPYASLPEVRLLIREPAGTSWPSSHPAVLMAFVSVAGAELGLSRARRAALSGLAGVVGLSRVTLGVHYPSDVVGGLLLGRALGDAWTSSDGTSRR